MSTPYDDMLHLPRPVSKTHPPLSLHDRAAQFSPFAALSGYSGAIAEAGRRTRERPELDETAQTALDQRLRKLKAALPRRPTVTFTYFRPDSRKAGGAVCTVTGVVKKLDEARRHILLEDGTVLPMDDLLGLR